MDTAQLHINYLPDIVRAFDSHEELEALCGYSRVLDAELHDRLVAEDAPTCEQCQKLMDEELSKHGVPTRYLSSLTVDQLRQEYNRTALGYSIKITSHTGTWGTRPPTRFDFPLAG